MTSTGHWRKYLKELFAYMKMDYHTTHANIHALMGASDTVSYMDSLDLSDISDYEDYMVTSSDEELPGMKKYPIDN